LVRGCIHKKIAGSKNSKENSMWFFFQKLVFGDLQSHPDGCRRSPHLADVVNFILIGNRPPWHLMLVINTTSAQFWLHRGTGATLPRATVKPDHDSCVSLGTFYAKSGTTLFHKDSCFFVKFCVPQRFVVF
jgi:hypothetical protein